MRRLVIGFCLGIAGFVPPVTASAAGGDEQECEGGSVRDEVTGICITIPDTDPDPGDGDGTPACPAIELSWAQLFDYALMDPNTQFGDGYRYYAEDGRAMRETPDGEVEYGVQYRRWDADAEACVGAGIDFLPDGTPEPDPVEVSIDEARERVPEPELDISPSLTAGGVVNLGMWLSVSNSEDVSATASGRGTSVTATATLVETSWDMGDGTTVRCAGDGEAIDPNSDAFESVEEGPCGHTYTQPGAFTITVTATWEVTWAATDGRSGTAPPIIQTASFAYDVVEIQTVGTNN